MDILGCRCSVCLCSCSYTVGFAQSLMTSIGQFFSCIFSVTLLVV